MYTVMHVLITLSSSSLKETLWKKEVHDSSELRQVTCAVAYDIQGEHHLVMVPVMEILFHLGRPLAMRLLYKAPRTAQIQVTVGPVKEGGGEETYNNSK